jgi:hypothetical protein
MTVLVNRGRTAAVELQAIAHDLAMLAVTPPEFGYGDGYDVIHVIANLDEEASDFVVDQADPYRLEVCHAPGWEEIVPEIKRSLDWFESGATQGFVVLRHDPKRSAPRLPVDSGAPQDVALCPDCNGSGERARMQTGHRGVTSCQLVDCQRCNGDGTLVIENLTPQERVGQASALLESLSGFSVMFDPSSV